MELAALNRLKCIFSPPMTKFLLIPLFFLTVMLAAQDTVHQEVISQDEGVSFTPSTSTSTSTSKPVRLPLHQILEPKMPHPTRNIWAGITASNFEINSFFTPIFTLRPGEKRHCLKISLSDRWLVFRQIRV